MPVNQSEGDPHPAQRKLVSKMLKGNVPGVKRLSNGGLCIKRFEVSILFPLERALIANGWKGTFFRKADLWVPEPKQQRRWNESRLGAWIQQIYRYIRHR